MLRRPPGRSRLRRVLTPCLLALAFVLSAVVTVASTPTTAQAQADGDCQITAEPDPDCDPPPPEPPPFDEPVPCALFPDNPYGPYCGVLGDFFDPNSPCTPFYCGGPFVVPIEIPAVVDHEVITQQLLEAIRVRENRPNQLTESELTTVAGIPASMATFEQATIGYTLDALRDYSAFRGFGTGDPNDTLTAWPLYMSDINQGYQRVNATRDLLTAVNNAVAAGLYTPEEFIGHNTSLFVSTGLSVEDVRTMYRAVPLRAQVADAHARVVAASSNENVQVQLADQEVAQIPVADRLGIRAVDLRRYIVEGNIWAENNRAWERKAVRTLPNNLGYKFEARAVYGGGRYMAQLVIQSRVQNRIAQAGCGGPGTLCLSIDEATVVRYVAAANHAGVAGANSPAGVAYGAQVLTIYCRQVYGTVC